MKFKSAIVCFAALFHAVTSQAAPAPDVYIDFSTFKLGELVSPVSGVTFSLLDLSGEKTAPTIFSQDGITGLGTNAFGTVLYANFTSAVENISFTFNSLPSSPSAISEPWVYYESDVPGTSGGKEFRAGNGITVTLSDITAVRSLMFVNFSDGSGTTTPFSLSSLQATVSAVPEPSSALMFGLGLTALLAARRRQTL